MTGLPHALRFPRFGLRNVLYIGFVVACIGYGILHQTQFVVPDIARMGVGIGIGVALWAIGTLPYFLWNAVALVAALARDRPASRAAFGIALPLVALVLGWPLVLLLDAWLVHPP